MALNNAFNAERLDLAGLKAAKAGCHQKEIGRQFQERRQIGIPVQCAFNLYLRKTLPANGTHFIGKSILGGYGIKRMPEAISEGSL